MNFKTDLESLISYLWMICKMYNQCMVSYSQSDSVPYVYILVPMALFKFKLDTMGIYDYLNAHFIIIQRQKLQQYIHI